MGKSKAQGTRWESRVRDIARDFFGLLSERYAEGGAGDVGDVWINAPVTRDTEEDMLRPLVVVAWRRLVKSDHSKRVPDGSKEVVVMELEDFMHMVESLVTTHAGWKDTPIVVECKAAERLNITRVLGKAIDKVDTYRTRLLREPHDDD